MKSKEREALEKLIARYDKLGRDTYNPDGSILKRGDSAAKTMAAKLRVDLGAMEDSLRQGHLDTAMGDIPQAVPKASGRAAFQPMNMQNFALKPFISDNPMSLGGQTFAPVDRELLNPYEKRRSPYWNLFGYS